MNPSEPVRYPSLEGGIDAIFACLSFFHLNGNLGLGERRNGWGFLFRFYHLLGRKDALIEHVAELASGARIWKCVFLLMVASSIAISSSIAKWIWMWKCILMSMSIACFYILYTAPLVKADGGCIREG